MGTDILNIRVGHGYDVHPFAPERKLVLGGVDINYRFGLSGHSDADVLTHSVIDSLLSASNSGNIGLLFPDSNSMYKDIRSIELLQEVNNILIKKNILIINIDSTIICEEPRISPYVNDIKHSISSALNGLDLSRINIKGKTTEKLGFTGRGEGIEVHTVSLIKFG